MSICCTCPRPPPALSRQVNSTPTNHSALVTGTACLAEVFRIQKVHAPANHHQPEVNSTLNTVAFHLNAQDRGTDNYDINNDIIMITMVILFILLIMLCLIKC